MICVQARVPRSGELRDMTCALPHDMHLDRHLRMLGARYLCLHPRSTNEKIPPSGFFAITSGIVSCKKLSPTEIDIKPLHPSEDFKGERGRGANRRGTAVWKDSGRAGRFQGVRGCHI